jgi:hypothetical protein
MRKGEDKLDITANHYQQVCGVCIVYIMESLYKMTLAVFLTLLLADCSLSKSCLGAAMKRLVLKTEACST